MAVRHVAEVELDAGAEEPIQWDFIDGHHAFAVDRRRLEMRGRVHVGAIMAGELEDFESPAFAAGKILLPQARKGREQHRSVLDIAQISDLRPHEGMIEYGLVVERRGQIEHAAWHFHGFVSIRCRSRLSRSRGLDDVWWCRRFRNIGIVFRFADEETWLGSQKDFARAAGPNSHSTLRSRLFTNGPQRFSSRSISAV